MLMQAEESQQKEANVNVPIETEFSKKGKTKLIPYENRHTRFRVGLFREVWIKGEGNRFRAYRIIIQLGENTIVLSSHDFWDVLSQAGKHLALLTEPGKET
jgi:hypothetical protein